jgi:uncharacterized protein with HEPN domain
MPPKARVYLQHILDETRYLGANLPGLERIVCNKIPILEKDIRQILEERSRLAQ